jgi:hypothetical protein
MVEPFQKHDGLIIPPPLQDDTVATSKVAPLISPRSYSTTKVLHVSVTPVRRGLSEVGVRESFTPWMATLHFRQGLVRGLTGRVSSQPCHSPRDGKPAFHLPAHHPAFWGRPLTGRVSEPPAAGRTPVGWMPAYPRTER